MVINWTIESNQSLEFAKSVRMLKIKKIIRKVHIVVLLQVGISSKLGNKISPDCGKYHLLKNFLLYLPHHKYGFGIVHN